MELNPQNTIINEVVISASRVPEKVLKSPIAIEKIDIRTIRESPATSFYETLENVKRTAAVNIQSYFKSA